MNPDTHKTLADLIEESLEKYRANPAFSCLGQVLNFSEIEKKSRALAVWLQQDSGLEAGDRVAIQLPNLSQYPIIAYAIIRAGMVVVNTNPLYTEREMAHQFKDSGAKAIFIVQSILPSLANILDQTQITKVIEVGPTDLITGTTAVTVPHHEGFSQLIERYQDQALAPRNAPSDTIVLQYTGGTTGLSKGAELTSTNLISHYHQALERLGDSCKEGQEIFVAPLPLYHIYAFSMNLLVFALQGNLSVLIPDPRNMDAFVAAIKPYKFSAFSGINTLLVGLCQHPGFLSLDFSKLKLTASGGATLTSSAANLWMAVTGCTVTEGYGLSESSGALTINQPGQEVVGTVGAPLFDTVIEIRNHENATLPDGQAGEVVAKGPQIMKGYWNRPDETAKVMTPDGFFKTGDVGLRLPSGVIKIVDRLKDMVIVSGFNVYPNEIEDILTRHPLINEAAVVGEPDERSGEKICAYITLCGDLDESQVIAHCREMLTAYKIPKKVVILAQLPKSTVGKILRRELRKLTADAAVLS